MNISGLSRVWVTYQRHWPVIELPTAAGASIAVLQEPLAGCFVMLNPMATILIVEDDALLLDALTGQLQQLEFGVHTASSVAEANTLLQSQAVDGIILDLGLPGVPAMLRRARQPAFAQASSAAGGASPPIGPLVLDHASHSEALNGDLLDLTQREWELLELLVNRCGEVVTRDDVLAAWRASPPEPGQTAAPPLNSNALEVYVHRLRKKLDTSPLAIRNIRWLGYMLNRP